MKFKPGWERGKQSLEKENKGWNGFPSMYISATNERNGGGRERKGDLPSFRKFSMDKLSFGLMPWRFSNRGMVE